MFPQPMWNVVWVSQSTVSTCSMFFVSIIQYLVDKPAGKALIILGHIRGNNKKPKNHEDVQTNCIKIGLMGLIIDVIMGIWLVQCKYYQVALVQIHTMKTWIFVVSWFTTNDSATLLTGKVQWMRQEPKSEFSDRNPNLQGATGVQEQNKKSNTMIRRLVYGIIFWGSWGLIFAYHGFFFKKLPQKKNFSLKKWSD